MLKKKVKGIFEILMPGILTGFLIGFFNTLFPLLLSAPYLNRSVPSVLMLLSASINRWVLITVLAFILLRICFWLARKFGSLLGGVNDNKAIGLLLALIISCVIIYFLLGYRRPIGHLFTTLLPGRTIRALRLRRLAPWIAFSVLIFFSYWVLCKVDYRGIDRRILRIARSRLVKWSCAVCLVAVLVLNISGNMFRSNMNNIIFITIDTLRQDHLAYAGYGRETSPNMEKLGADGITFLQATSFSDWTMSSHENMLTGRYPVSSITACVPPSSELLPEILKRYGYKTAAFVSGEWCKGKFGLNQGFDFYDDDFPEALRKIDEYYDGIINWLDHEARSPFFLWLHLFEPHFPYEAHKEYVWGFSQPTKFDNYNKYFGSEEEMFQLWENRMNLEEKDIERAKALYDSEISYIDEYLGRFLDALTSRGLFDTSMIIVTSDHGEGFGERGMYFYHTYNITEEITRVPLIIKMPGNSPAGKIVEEQVQTSDIFATILDMTGISHQGNILSKSLLPLIRGTGSSDKRYACSYSADAQSYSVRDGRFKLIYSDKDREYALYDIGSDPQETVNIRADKPEIFLEMRKQLDVFRQAFSLFASEHRRANHIKIDEETRKRLRALGYIH